MSKIGKIFFVVGSFKVGGTEKVAIRIGKQLIQEGWDVKFILFKSIYDYKDEVVLSNTISLRSEEIRNNFLKVISCYLKLFKLIMKHRPKKIISFSLGINFFIFFTFHKNIVFTIETNIFYFRKRLYRRYLTKYFSLFPNVKKIIVPSQELKLNCSKYFFTSNKIVAINNPVDVDYITSLAKESIDDYKFLKEKKFIVSVGRLAKGKGFKQLIKIFVSLEWLKDKQLVIIGEGESRKELEELIAEYNIENRVFILGFQQNPYKFIARSKYLVLNSVFESFGNVLLEAMACGVPAISNDCDFGPREIIKNYENGILFIKEDENSFKEALLLPFQNTTLYNSMCLNTTSTALNYDVPKIADIWKQQILS